MHPLGFFSDVLGQFLSWQRRARISSFNNRDRRISNQREWEFSMQRLDLQDRFLIETDSKCLSSSLLNYTGVVLFSPTAMWDMFSHSRIASMPINLLLFTDCPFWQTAWFCLIHGGFFHVILYNIVRGLGRSLMWLWFCYYSTSHLWAVLIICFLGAGL